MHRADPSSFRCSFPFRFPPLLWKCQLTPGIPLSLLLRKPCSVRSVWTDVSFHCCWKSRQIRHWLESGNDSLSRLILRGENALKWLTVLSTKVPFLNTARLILFIRTTMRDAPLSHWKRIPQSFTYLNADWVIVIHAIPRAQTTELPRNWENAINLFK